LRGQLTAARNFQRKAQFYLDFVKAENSTGFHAPQEAAHVLGESINFSRQGQLALKDGIKPGSLLDKPHRFPGTLSITC
jgi:formate-dependent nitrite reductase cytochrome c552 subunit